MSLIPDGIINQTSAMLTWDAANTSTSHGGLLPPPEQIGPGATDVAGAQSGGDSVGTGCEGVISYGASANGETFSVRLHYDNPFVGSNSADA
jgi:hypothetical protein